MIDPPIYRVEDQSEIRSVFLERVGNNFCSIDILYGRQVYLQMRSSTGNWTYVQDFHVGNGRSTINKSSNFKAPAPVMAEFLRACLEVL